MLGLRLKEVPIANTLLGMDIGAYRYIVPALFIHGRTRSRPRD